MLEPVDDSICLCISDLKCPHNISNKSNYENIEEKINDILKNVDRKIIPLYLKSTEPSYVPDAPNRLRFGDYNNAEDWAKEKKCTKLLIHYGQDFHKELADLIIETLMKKGIILND